MFYLFLLFLRGLAYSPSIRLENRILIANGVAPCPAPRLYTGPRSHLSSLINADASSDVELCLTASTSGRGWRFCSLNPLRCRTLQPEQRSNCIRIQCDSGATPRRAGASFFSPQRDGG